MNTELIKTIDKIYKELSKETKNLQVDIICTIETNNSIYRGTYYCEKEHKYDFVKLDKSSMILGTEFISTGTSLIQFNDIKNFSYEVVETPYL